MNDDVIQIYVGVAANNEDLESQSVLEYTLRKYSSLPVNITWMKLSRSQTSPFYCDPKNDTGWKGWRTDLWSTPFSGFRWAVPALAWPAPRAIYMDSDVIIRADIAELWRMPLEPGKVLAAKGGAESWRYCVTLFDCDRLENLPQPWPIPWFNTLRGDPESHRNAMKFFAGRPDLVQAFPADANWNCIDGEDYADINDPRIKILHYSSEAHQPQLKYALPRLEREGGQHWFDGEVKQHWRQDIVDLFDREFAFAMAGGFSTEKYRREPFGPYVKASNANYTSHKWAK